MFMSQARLAANRQNAQRSTGPNTPEGKARSRENALKHGFAAEVLTLPDENVILDEAFPGDTNSTSPSFPEWLIDQVALLSVRLDRLHEVEARRRQRVQLRARLCWNEDRRIAAENLGAQLSKNPGATVRKLRQTPQGCDWLIERWEALGRLLREFPTWDPCSTGIAFDLLGVPPELRAVDPSPGINPQTLVRTHVEEIKAHKARIQPADDFDRKTAESDLEDAPDVESRRIRRYERDLERRLRWCLDQLAKLEKAEDMMDENVIKEPATAETLEASDTPRGGNRQQRRAREARNRSASHRLSREPVGVAS
jgi:hypothetical protein